MVASYAEMLREEEVLSWFRDSESYRRIDVLCGLLNMCLPFELRFAGAYVEELGKRDFHELRGAELRANNPDELRQEVSGVAQDPRAPRRMALYVSLLRSCNSACARTLHKVLLGLERTGLLQRPEPVDELLLLYTMALHHPAFTFDQRSHYAQVLDRLKMQLPPPPPAQQEQQQQQPPPQLHHPEIAYAPYNVLDYAPVHAVAPWDANAPPPPPPAAMLVHEIMPPEIYNFSTQQSPMISQPTSPCDSRPVSPSLQQPPPILPGSRSSSRPNPDIPIVPQQPLPPDRLHHPQHQLIANFNHLNIGELRLMEDERLHDIGFPTNAVVQLRSIEKLNGMQRSKPPPPMYSYAQTRHQRSSGSDSGSSTGSRSPPDTPAPAPLLPSRPRQPTSPLYLQPQQTPYAAVPQHYPRSVYPAAYAAATYRPGYSPFATANGEAPTVYGAQYNAATASYMPVQIYAQPKLSCWNCGSVGHSGNECKEPSIEEVTRAGGYQLDYSTAPPDTNDK